MAFIVAVLFSAALFAQQNLTISGKVVAASNGNALSGVTVTVKNTQNGTTTDEAGNFTIAAPQGATLVFSSVGFQESEVKVSSNTSLTITLTAADKGLEEVVVVGYGSQRKRDITAAVSSVNIDDLGELPSRSVTQMIQGQAPGVVATQRNGTPGGEFEVRIRYPKHLYFKRCVCHSHLWRPWLQWCGIDYHKKCKGRADKLKPVG